MPKLKKHCFTHHTADNDKHTLETDIYVSADGVFNCIVPDFLVAAIEAVASTAEFKARKNYVAKAKTYYRAYAETSAELLSFVGEAFDQYHRAEVVSEFIICYDWFSEVSYWLNPDGTMAAHGGMPDAAPRNREGTGGEWGEHKLKNGTAISSTAQAKHFSVGVFACVYKRSTYTSVSGQVVTWDRIGDHESGASLGPFGHRLNSIRGLSAPHKPEAMQQMPYAEDAAEFFYNSLMAMCDIGRRFKAFFGDDRNVFAAIQGHGPNLLPAPGKAST